MARNLLIVIVTFGFLSCAAWSLLAGPSSRHRPQRPTCRSYGDFPNHGADYELGYIKTCSCGKRHKHMVLWRDWWWRPILYRGRALRRHSTLMAKQQRKLELAHKVQKVAELEAWHNEWERSNRGGYDS